MTQPQYMEATQRQQCSYRPTLLHDLHEGPRFEAHRFKSLNVLKVTASPNSTESAEGIDEEPTKKAGRGAPRKVRTNTLKPYLQGVRSAGYALSLLPDFDDIVTGAVNIDLGNNTRPLSKKLVITLLQILDVISTEAIQDYMRLTLRSCSERNAQKYAQCLRVILLAATKVAETKWPSPDEVSKSITLSSAEFVASCGKDTCIICSGSPQQVWGWTQHATGEDAACDYDAACIEQVANTWNPD